MADAVIGSVSLKIEHKFFGGLKMKTLLIGLTIATMTATSSVSFAKRAVEAKAKEVKLSKEVKQAIGKASRISKGLMNDSAKMKVEAPTAFSYMQSVGAVRPNGKINERKLSRAIVKDMNSLIKNGTLTQADVLVGVLSKAAPENRGNLLSNLRKNRAAMIGLSAAIATRNNFEAKDYDLAHAIIKSAVLTMSTSKNLSGKLQDGVAAKLLLLGYSLKEIVTEFEGKDRIISLVNKNFSDFSQVKSFDTLIASNIRQKNALALLGKEGREKARRCVK